MQDVESNMNLDIYNKCLRKLLRVSSTELKTNYFVRTAVVTVVEHQTPPSPSHEGRSHVSQHPTSGHREGWSTPRSTEQEMDNKGKAVDRSLLAVPLKMT